MTARRMTLTFRLGLCVLLLGLLFACTEAGEDTPDGDILTPDGESDGDAPDGDGPDGDDPSEDGDTPEDGDDPDGDDPIEDGDDPNPVDHNFPDAEATPNAFDGVEYLIVSSPDMVDAWQELADWKTEKGVVTRVVSMDTVLEESSGRDEAEALRYWLMEQGELHPLSYVLLGGDTPLVPHREFFSYTDVFGLDYYDGVVASDLYFADWDGTWDANENDTWAEFEDDLDMIPEVSLTRLPFDNAEEVSGFVAKLLTYEQAPPADYVGDVLFLSEDTGFSGLDSSWGLDPLSQDPFPSHFNFTKLYYEPSPFPDAELNTKTAQRAALEAGPHFVVHFGHGGGEDVGYMDREDIEELSNSPRNTVYISTACESGGFHNGDRVGGDSFVVNPNGAGVAYFGNTNTGIGFPSGMAFITKLLKLLFSPKVDYRNLGRLNDQARYDFTLNSSGSSKMYLDGHPDRWTVLSMVVFADPEMPIWIDEPKAMEVTHPARLHAEKFRFGVDVRTKGKKPLAGARVVLWDGNGRLYRDWTDENGHAELRLVPGDAERLTLTVTANDHLPYSATLPVRR